MSTEQKEHLKELLALPSLDELAKRQEKLAKTGELSHISVRGLRYTMADVEKQLALWRIRDAIQATRPEGCFCLGLGGRGRRIWYGMEVPEEYCPCPDGILLEATLATFKSAYLETRRKHIKEKQWEAAQIPLRFREMRLETSPLLIAQPGLLRRLHSPEAVGWDDPNNPTVEPSDVQQAQWEAADKEFCGSWFFHGGYGTGKTGLAVGLAYERLIGGMMWRGDEYTDLRTILFTTVPALLSELRSTYGRHEEEKPTEQEVLQKYIQADLLILDDLGAEQVKGTGWVEDRLYQVIGERHDQMRSTIFTSNLSLDQLAQRIGERICWRIAEMCGPSNVVEVKGPNLRTG